jgi:ribonucleoside-diphosphate reductase beta chain
MDLTVSALLQKPVVQETTITTTQEPTARTLVEYFDDKQKEQKSLFLGKHVGLIENLDNQFPLVWDHYKKLKSLDWEETEIDISSCRAEFKSVNRDVRDLMIRTLAFQYEADSSAAHIGALVYPFINNSELMCYVTELGKNELLHSLAYKFIVENSFDDPNEFLTEVRSIKEAYLRLSNVNKVFQDLFVLGNRYNLGLEKDEKVIRKALLRLWVTMYALERIQFISSFAITFGLADKGADESYFVPIAKLVQKISTDEYQIHVTMDKIILKNELAIPEMFALWLEIMPEMEQLIDDVVSAETVWLDDYLFKDKKVIAGVECAKIKRFVKYTSQDVYDFFGMPLKWDRVTENPLPYMDKWLVIDKNQASPQEESIGNYLLGGFVDDSETVDMSRYTV